MKTLKSFAAGFALLAIITVLFSCTGFNYLGESYPPTTSVEVYYDVKEVKRPYKVIGRIAESAGYSGNALKKRVVSQAKKNGADGVIFSDFSSRTNYRNVESLQVEAKLIKYTE